MQAYSPTAARRELRLRQYHGWCVSVQDAANGRGGEGFDFFRPALPHQQNLNYQLAHDREATKKGSRKQWHCWQVMASLKGKRKPARKEAAEEGTPSNAKRKWKRPPAQPVQRCLGRVGRPE